MDNNEIRNNNNKSWVIGILSVLVILLVGYVVYTNFIKQENTNTNDNNNVKEETTTYKVEDYISIEAVQTDSSKIKLEKINFKNIDSSLVSDFIEKQNSIINNLKYLQDSDLSSDEFIVPLESVKTNIFYQINDDILSIKLEENYRSSLLTINIDLKNNKVLTTTDLLEIKNINKNEYVTTLYEKYIKKSVENSDNNRIIYDSDNVSYTKEEFLSAEAKHKSKIEKDLDTFDSIIKDGKVNVIYDDVKIASTCFYVPKDGFYERIVDEL